MTNKYKISELAKDFGLTSKDIIKIVAEKTGAEKKSGAALDEKEISLVFDTLTKQNEVKDSKPATKPSEPATTPSTTQPTTKPSTTQNTEAVKPKKTSIKKLSKGKKKFTVTWAKVSGVKGYQIQYSSDKKLKKNNKSVTVTKQKTTKATVKKLKSKKKYYVRVRTYKTVNGKKIYSSWSKVKSVKTK